MMTACLTGCKKGNETLPKTTADNSIRISIAEYKGETKSFIDGSFTEWENGDAVILGVNDDTGISADLNITYPGGSLSATTTVDSFTPTTGDDVWGAYPASLFREMALGESVAFTLPASYDYVTAFGHQTLAAPMVGYVKKTAGVDELVFRHACAILKINVEATVAYTLDEIQLVVTNNAGDENIQVSGGTTVNCKTAALGAWTSGSDANNTITLNMSGNRVALNEDRAFYIPVPPLASGTKIKIRLHNYEDGKWTVVNATTTAAIAGHTLSSFKSIPVTGGTEDYIFYDYLFNQEYDEEKGVYNKGAVYINLGVVPDYTTKVEMTFKVTETSGSQYYAGLPPYKFGISGSTHNLYLRTHFGEIIQSSVNSNGDGNTVPIEPHPNDIYRNTGNTYRVTHEIKPGSTTGYYYSTTTFEEIEGGVVIKSLTKNSSEQANALSGASAITLFALGSSSLNPGMKLYSFRLWKSGNLLHNFVPAKCVKPGDSNENQYGLYDMVDKSFKVKSGGSGSFTAGND